MDDEKPTSFIFEIDNFSEKEGLISSPKFSSGGYEWFVNVCRKGYHIVDRLSLHLQVANPESLPLGWKRKASYSFALLNQSGKEVYKTPESCKLFRGQFTGWGSPQAFSLKILQDMGLLEKNKLILKVQVKVIKALDEGDVTRQDRVILYSQFPTSLERKLGNIDGPNVQDLKELVKNLNLEMETEKAKSATCAAYVFSLEQTVSDLRVEVSKEKEKLATSAATVLSLEQMVSDLRVELSKEKDKSATPKDLLEGVVHSWEILDYADLTNENVE